MKDTHKTNIDSSKTVSSSISNAQRSTHSDSSKTIKCSSSKPPPLSTLLIRHPSSSNKGKKSSRSSKKHKRQQRSKIERLSPSRFDSFLLSRHSAIFFIGVTFILSSMVYYNSMTSNVMKKYQLLNKQQEDAEYIVHEQVRVKEDDSVPELNGLKNVWDSNDASDVPIFWHIAKSGGTSIKNVLSKCYKRILASEVGIRNGHAHDTEIQVFNHNGFSYVNVDTSTIEGIERARSMNLMSNTIKDLAIVSPWLHNIEKLFLTTKRHGRVFGMFRDPIHRAVSMYHYLQYATWEPSYNPMLKNMTLEQYAESKYIENNFVTRILTGKYTGALTSEDAIAATVILKRKILVGLQNRMIESMERYEKYFGFSQESNYNSSIDCRNQLLLTGFNVNVKKQNWKKNHILPKGRAYHLIRHHNKFDIQIYNVVVSMFEEQRSLIK